MKLRDTGVELSSQSPYNEAGKQIATGLPCGLLWVPYCDVASQVANVSGPWRCSQCQALFNGFCETSPMTRVWKCVLCGNLNKASESATLESVSGTDNVSDVMFEQYVVPMDEDRGEVSRLVLIIDENLGIEEAEMAKVVEIASSAAITRGLEVALVIFGEVVMGVDFHQSDGSDTYPVVVDALLPEEVREMSDEDKKGYFCADVELISDSVWTVVRSKQPALKDLSARARIQRRRSQKGIKQKRRLDAALDVAVELFPRARTRAVEYRVVTLLSGKPTLDTEIAEDDEEFEIALTGKMRGLGKEAADKHIVLDFFCFAAIHGFAASALQVAASATGGGLILSAMHGLSSFDHIKAVFRFITTRSLALGGQVEIRSSQQLQLEHVIGPAVEGDGESTFMVPSVERGVGFALFFELTDDWNEDSCFIQLVSSCSDSFLKKHTVRCITLRLRGAHTDEEFLRYLDVTSSVIMMAKRILLESLVPGTHRGGDTEKAIDSAALAIVDGSLGDTPEAKKVVRLLYDLRRGVLLGSQLHKDDAICLRALLCSAAPELVANLISPQLFRLVDSDSDVASDPVQGEIADSLRRINISLVELPSSEMSLNTEDLLIMDAGTEVFVWEGKGLAARNPTAAEKVRSVIASISSRRLPPAPVWSFREGDSMSRMMLCRLSPDERSSKHQFRADLSFEEYFRSLE